MGSQASKRGRRNRKEAKAAGFHKNVGHPSHKSGRRWKSKDNWKRWERENNGTSQEEQAERQADE